MPAAVRTKARILSGRGKTRRSARVGAQEERSCTGKGGRGPGGSLPPQPRCPSSAGSRSSTGDWPRWWPNSVGEMERERLGRVCAHARFLRRRPFRVYRAVGHALSPAMPSNGAARFRCGLATPPRSAETGRRTGKSVGRTGLGPALPPPCQITVQQLTLGVQSE